MNSAIYTGLVQHRRFLPKLHKFQYQAFMMYLDLDELPSLFDDCAAWSYNTPNLAYFKRADYFGDVNKPLKDAILAKVAQEINKKPAGKVCLLTNMRYFGYCFNPVSFYYCYGADNKTLEAIVTHITNTPWGKDYAYVHDCVNENSSLNLGFNFKKAFHVSPFMPMDIEYIWQFSRPGKHLSVYMQNRQDNKDATAKIPAEKMPGKKMFDATLTLQRLELNPETLNSVLLKYPFMTLKVIGAIYWQALQLWLKRIPFYPNPHNVN